MLTIIFAVSLIGATWFSYEAAGETWNQFNRPRMSLAQTIKTLAADVMIVVFGLCSVGTAIYALVKLWG